MLIFENYECSFFSIFVESFIISSFLDLLLFSLLPVVVSQLHLFILKI